MSAGPSGRDTGPSGRDTGPSGRDNGPRFETFVRDLADLRVGEEMGLALRDLAPGRRKYLARHVVGVVTREPSDGSVPLRVRSTVGNVVPGDWYVRVLRALPQRLPGEPYGDAFEGLRRAAEDARTPT